MVGETYDRAETFKSTKDIQEENIDTKNFTQELTGLKETLTKENPLIGTYLQRIDEFNKTNENDPDIKKGGFSGALKHIDDASTQKRLEDYTTYPRLLKFFRKETIDGKETLFIPRLDSHGNIVVAIWDKGRTIIPFGQDTNVNVKDGQPTYLTFWKVGAKENTENNKDFVQPYYTIFTDKKEITVSTVDTRPDNPMTSQAEQTSLMDYVKKGDWSGAISAVFGMISNIFGSGKGKHAKRFAENFDKLTTGSKLDALSTQELENTVTMYETILREIKNPQKIIETTYLLSYAKDILFQKKEGSKKSNYELFSKQIVAGDILLITPERKVSSLSDGDDLLTGVENIKGSNKYTFTHSMLVDEPVFTNNGDMNLIHSSDGGVQKITLSAYLQNKNAANIMVLRQNDQDIARKTITEMTGLLGKAYDSQEAVSGFVTGKIVDNDAYNCVSAITKSMEKAGGTTALQNASRPNEFLGQETLKPIYMKTIESI